MEIAEKRIGETPAGLVDTPGAVLPGKRLNNTRKSQAAAPLSPVEREKLRLALHDGLGQLLTSISFLGTALHAKLASQSSPGVDEAREIVTLTQRAISETQTLVNPGPPF